MNKMGPDKFEALRRLSSKLLWLASYGSPIQHIHSLYLWSSSDSTEELHEFRVNLLNNSDRIYKDIVSNMRYQELDKAFDILVAESLNGFSVGSECARPINQALLIKQEARELVEAILLTWGIS